MATSKPAVDQCPECAGPIARTDTDHHCRECGLVLDDSPIDHGPDWRSFNDEDGDPERAAPGDKSYAGDGMGSLISFDAEMSDRKREYHRRAKTRTKRDRNKAYLTGEVRRIASALELPDGCADQAAHLMTDLYAETEDLNGKDLDTVAAAGVYLVARVRQQGVAPDEVVDVARDVDRKIMLKRRRWLCETLGVSVPVPDLRQRLTVVAADLDVSDATVRSARRLLDSLDGTQTQRAKPSTVVAALLWRVSDHTQSECGDAAGCTPHAIRRYHQLLPDDPQTELADY